MIKKILVVWELGCDNKLLLNKAGKLAKATGAHVVLSAFVSTRKKHFADDMEISDLKHKLDNAAQEHLKTDNEIETHVFACTEPADAILDCHEKDGYDLVIKSKDDKDEFLNAPEDWQLIRNLSCALLIIQKHARKSKSTLLATVDINEKKDEQYQMNDTVLAWAAYLSEQYQSDFDVLYNIPISKPMLELDVFEPDTVLSEQGKDARLALQDVLDLHNSTPNQLHIHAGDIGKNMKGISGKLKPEMVIVGSVGRKGVKGFLVGNTAEKVLKNSRSDILVVKPD